MHVRMSLHASVLCAGSWGALVAIMRAQSLKKEREVNETDLELGRR